MKRNEFQEIFGGLAPEGCKLFNLYKARAAVGTDITDYTGMGATGGRMAFAAHYGQLLSAAVVVGDAIRSLEAVDKTLRDCRRAGGAHRCDADGDVSM